MLSTSGMNPIRTNGGMKMRKILAHSRLARPGAMVLSLLFLIAPVAGWTQTTTATARFGDLSNHEIYCFCNAVRGTPDRIVRMDNNGAILAACQGGRTIEQLRAGGVAVTDSQIRLLQDWGLLRKDEGGSLRTTFPIFGQETVFPLRKLARASAADLVRNTRTEIRQLLDLLSKAGQEGSAYTLLFSYVLDDQVWEQFYADKLLVDRDPSLDEPFWTGVVWAYSPPREFSCGTNFTSNNGISLAVNWSPALADRMGPLMGGWRALRPLIEACAEKKWVEDPGERRLFSSYQLCDDQGRPTLAILTESESDPVFQMVSVVAKKVATHAAELARSDSVRTLLGTFEDAPRLVITYHELMWEILEETESNGLIRKPAAFADPEHAREQDLGKLVFAIRHAPDPSADDK